MPRIKEGFKGERIVVLPGFLIEELKRDPLGRELYITDIGYYPHAGFHYCERKEEDSNEFVLIYCVEGEGWFELDGKRYLSKETCRVFTTTVSRISRRGLGFDKPDRHNPQKSPCAESAPASVYGHTGFTGTCAWTDPENGLVYVFLSNRTYPDVWNNKLMRLDIRTRIQEAVYKAMLGGKK